MPTNVTKSKVARGLVGFYITVEYLDQMEDNYRKGDWLEAGKDTAFYAAAMLPVVAPKFFWGTVMYPVTVFVASTFVATWVIVELTGIGDVEDVAEIYLNPVETLKSYPEVVGPAIVENITDPAITYLEEELWQKQLVEPIGGWLSRRKREIKRIWAITRPRMPTWL